MSDPEVKAVFINIFGGILRCDVSRHRRRRRCQGSEAECFPSSFAWKEPTSRLGQQILRESGLNFHHRRRHEGRLRKKSWLSREVRDERFGQRKNSPHRPGLHRPRKALFTPNR